MKSKSDLVREYVEKYIELGMKNGTGYSKRWITGVILAENPKEFKDFEEVRYYVRKVTHAAGTTKPNRARIDDDLARRFALLEPPFKELENTEPFIFPNYNKTLWIADLHSRFYDREALETAINYGIKRSCNSVVILGDFMDFYGYSKFQKSRLTLEQFETEREWGQSVLEMLQATFGYVVLKQGNHDVRREMFVQAEAVRIPEMRDICGYADYLFYEGSNVNIVESHRHIVYGKLNAIHGHEYFGGGGIHIAHNRLNKTFDNTLSAHSHYPQSLIKPNINGQYLGSWTLGCMCQLHAAYAPKNNWSHGCAVTEKEADGMFEVDNKLIVKNRMFAV